MKKVLICIFLFTALVSQGFAGNPALFGISLVASKNGIMYMRFDHELDGAKIEIYNHDGNLIATHYLKRHKKHKGKLIIDFIEAIPGNYTVVVVKNDKFRAFHYTQFDFNDFPMTYSVSSLSNEVKFYEKHLGVF